MIRFLLLFFAVLLSFTSCTTVEDVSTRPSWVDNTPVVSGMRVFIGNGEGQSEVEARSNAIGDVLSQMEEELGYDLHDKYFRELFSSKEIGDLGTVVADEYNWELDGTWHCYVATTTDENTFNAARSIEYLDELDRISRIEGYLDSSMAFYRQNRDVEAIEMIIEAVIVSLEGEIREEGYDPYTLLDKALSYISSIRISSEKPNKNTPADSFVFRLVRTKGLMHPMVENASVECSYKALSVDGGIKSFSHLSRTDSKGRFVFNRTNSYTLHSGDIIVKIHLDDDLMFRLSLVAPEELVKLLNQTIEEGKLVYPYSYGARQDVSDVLFALAEYGFDGASREEDGVLKKTLTETFKTLEIEGLNIVFASGEEAEESVELLLSQYSDYRRIYAIRMGVVDTVEVGDKTYSRSEGRVIILDLESGERREIEDFHYTAAGDTPRSAGEESLLVLSQVISGFLLGEF